MRILIQLNLFQCSKFCFYHAMVCIYYSEITPKPLIAPVNTTATVRCYYGDTTGVATQVMGVWPNDTENPVYTREMLAGRGINCTDVDAENCSYCDIFAEMANQGLTITCYTADLNDTFNLDNVTLEIKTEPETPTSSEDTVAQQSPLPSDSQGNKTGDMIEPGED